MKVTVKYLAQARHATGCAAETLELNGSCVPAELIRQLAERHGEPLQRLLLAPGGKPHDALLLFVGEEQVRAETVRELRDGDVVTVLTPMAGG